MKDSPARKEKKRIGRIVARLAEEITVSHVHAKPNKEYLVPRRFRYFCEPSLRDISHEHAFCQHNYRRNQKGLEPRTLEQYHFLKAEMVSEKSLTDNFGSQSGHFDVSGFYSVANPQRAENLEKWMKLKGAKLTSVR